MKKEKPIINHCGRSFSWLHGQPEFESAIPQLENGGAIQIPISLKTGRYPVKYGDGHKKQTQTEWGLFLFVDSLPVYLGTGDKITDIRLAGLGLNPAPKSLNNEFYKNSQKMLLERIKAVSGQIKAIIYASEEEMIDGLESLEDEASHNVVY